MEGQCSFIVVSRDQIGERLLISLLLYLLFYQFICLSAPVRANSRNVQWSQTLEWDAVWSSIWTVEQFLLFTLLPQWICNWSVDFQLQFKGLPINILELQSFLYIVPNFQRFKSNQTTHYKYKDFSKTIANAWCLEHMDINKCRVSSFQILCHALQLLLWFGEQVDPEAAESNGSFHNNSFLATKLSQGRLTKKAGSLSAGTQGWEAPELEKTLTDARQTLWRERELALPNITELSGSGMKSQVAF